MSLDVRKHLGRVVGNGHCVALLQSSEVGLPHTSKWRRGTKARGGDLPPGTPIATFDPGGQYANATDGSSHAAILIGETPAGLDVYDCWVGQPVHRRTIRFKNGAGKPVDDGDQYFSIETTA